MSDGALRISITGDASQFTKTLSKLEADLKDFKDKLKTATGVEIPKLNLQIVGAETSIKQITEFGKFAEGSLGKFIQLQKELEGKRLISTNPAEIAEINKRLAETANTIKEIKSAGIEKPIPIRIEPPPPGSIADIKKQISELTEQRGVSVGVDLSNANIKLQELRSKLKELESEGIEIKINPISPAPENSIAGLRQRIRELNEQRILIDPKVNPSALAKINQEIDGLEDKVQNLENLGGRVGGSANAASGGLKNLEKTSRDARIAVTSLSLVAQDLAFGFIAIQNNIPQLQQSFAALKAGTNGSKETFAALREALVGPAGMFLAFSVVTGAVTFAIQKYGSLSGAIEALFGRYTDLGDVVKRAKEEIDKFNKSLVTNNELISKSFASVQGNITKAEALGKVVLDLTKSENERKLALQSLQKLDKNRFKAFDVEKNKLDGLKVALDGYTQGQIAASKADTFSNQLNRQSEIVETNRNALFSLQEQIDELTKKYPNITSEVKNYEKAQLAATKTFGVRPFISIPEKDVLRFQQLTTESEKFSKQLIDSNNKLEELRATTSSFVTEASAADTFEEAATGVNKLKKAVKDLDIAELERQGRIAAFKLEEQAYKNRLKAVEDNIKAEGKLFDEIEKRFAQDAADADKLTKKVAPNASIERTTEPLAEIQRQYQLAFTAINQTFFEPLQNLFETFLNTGKFTFKEFTKSVLKSITAVVSKLAATGVITGLMYLLNPSGMLAGFGGSFGGGQGGGNGILSALGSVFGAQPRRPDFNGVRPQGGGRGGEKVEFQIRGTNLVGVLNRANGEINRIG